MAKTFTKSFFFFQILKEMTGRGALEKPLESGGSSFVALVIIIMKKNHPAFLNITFLELVNVNWKVLGIRPFRICHFSFVWHFLSGRNKKM